MDHGGEAIGASIGDLAADRILVHPLRDMEGRLDDVYHREEVDGTSILDTDARENACVGRDRLLKLVHEAALAHPGLAHDIDDLGLPLPCPLEGCLEGIDLRPAADECGHSSRSARVEPCANTGVLGDNAKDFLRLGFTLQFYLSHRLVLEKTLDEVSRILAHPDLAGRRRLLQAGREVNGIPDRGVVHTEVVPDGPDHDRAGVEADADFEVDG